MSFRIYFVPSVYFVSNDPRREEQQPVLRRNVQLAAFSARLNRITRCLQYCCLQVQNFLLPSHIVSTEHKTNDTSVVNVILTVCEDEDSSPSSAYDTGGLVGTTSSFDTGD